ncbi:MAG: urea carboxylase-associated family protein, partial [Pseudomonadota bacterium]|nr:urea carboxylase-associated family protein [Pseudomonadota bacterium]
MSNEILTIPARKGVAAAVHAGHSVHVINTHGQQVVDTWAFNADDISEFMSMEHSRAAFRRANPRTGDTYVTNRRRPILHVAEDTSPGIHDTLIAACDPYRYEQLGHVGHHDNCTENLHAALSKLGREATETPSPLNLFMNIEIKTDGDLEWLPPVSKPGDTIILRVEMDCVVVFSACPMDLLPINGVDNEP